LRRLRTKSTKWGIGQPVTKYEKSFTNFYFCLNYAMFEKRIIHQKRLGGLEFL